MDKPEAIMVLSIVEIDDREDEIVLINILERLLENMKRNRERITVYICYEDKDIFGGKDGKKGKK